MVRALVLAVVASLVAASSASGVPLIGVSWDTSTSATTVWSIDSTTGAGVAVGVSGRRGLNSLARRSDGVVFSSSTFLPPFSLVRIDPYTGASTHVVAPDFGIRPEVRALAFAPDDELYALVRDDDSGSNLLFSVDLVTGKGTLLADLGIRFIQAMEFSPEGALYGWEIDTGLVTIDVDAEAVLPVGPTVRANIQGLAFAPDGTLYGAGLSLFTIDVLTGALDEVGPIGVVGSRGGESIRGIAFVPEPTSFSLLAMGMAWIGSHRRASRRTPAPPSSGCADR